MVLFIGKVAVAAAGTPQPAYAGSPLAEGRRIVVQALPGNAGKVYVGSSAMNKGTGAAVGAALTAGTVFELAANGPGNPLNPEYIYLDADNSGEGAYVTLVG